MKRLIFVFFAGLTCLVLVSFAFAEDNLQDLNNPPDSKDIVKDKGGPGFRIPLVSALLNLKTVSAKVPQTPNWDALTLYATRLARPITRLDEVPVNVTIKDKDYFWENTPKTFQEAVQDTEGVILYDTVGNGLDTTFGLRGFPESDAAVFLLDGVRINEVDGGAVSYPLIVMDDIDYLEIDRGSSSPIYGSGAFSGVVHLRTRKPSDKLIHLFGGLEFSSFKGIRFNQGVDGSIPDKLTPFNGKWTYYFDGGRNVISEGFKDNDESRLTHFNIKAGYELPDNQGGIRVGVKHVEDYISNPGEQTLSQYHANPQGSNKPLDFNAQKSTIVQIDADKKFWDDKITASIMNSWRFWDSTFQNTFGTFFDWANGYNPDTHRIFQKSRERDLVWQLEYADEWNSWLTNKSSIGMEYRKSLDQARQMNAFQGVVRWNDGPDTDRVANYENLGLFWGTTVGLFEKLHVRYGMRHDFHWLKSQDYVAPVANLSRRWNKSTLSIGGTYQPFKFIDIFGNYSQGFRVPTISDIAPFSMGIATDLQPEKSDSYEVGARLRYKKRYSFKFSFFLTDVKNEIVYDNMAVTAATPFGRNTNVGETRRKGVELRFDTNPIDEFYLYSSYTWTSARVRSTSGAGGPVDGRALGQVPANRMTYGATIVPFKRLGAPFDGLRFSMDGVFTGRQHPQSYESTSEANLMATGYWIKSFSIWNLKLSYELKGMQIYFKVNNLFDEKYFSRAISAQSFGTAIYPAGRYLFVNRGAPREFVWGTKYEF